MNSLMERVIALVQETRAMSLPHYGTIEVAQRKTASAHDVVTQLDHNIEHFLAERLKILDAGTAFRGEEFGGEKSADRFWLCDPIDGTAHLVRGLPFCTTMLALIERGVVTFSVIYNFVDDVLYHAVRGGGAWRNGHCIHVSNRPLSDAYLSCETHINRPQNLSTYLKLRSRASFVATMNCGYEFAMIAEGRLEGRIMFDPWGYEWDYAPGALLVAEAGGVVANMGSRSYNYLNKDFIAANPAVFAGLTEGPDAIFPIRE